MGGGFAGKDFKEGGFQRRLEENDKDWPNFTSLLTSETEDVEVADSEFWVLGVYVWIWKQPKPISSPTNY